MKRILSLIICITMLVAVCPTVFGQESDKMQDVLLMIKPRIPDTSRFTIFDSHITTEGSKTLYNFSWSDNNQKSMYVSATEGGIITEYGFFEEIRGEVTNRGFDRIDSEEAIRRTQALVNKLNPTLSGKFVVEADGPENWNSDKLYFTLRHKEGGVPVQGNTGRVTVDIDATKITSFRINYVEGLKYISPYGIISRDEATAAFGSQLGLTLSYRIYKDYQNRKITAFPVYTAENGNNYIDAHTGKVVNVTPYHDVFYVKNESMSDTLGSAGGGLSEAEIQEIENVSSTMSAKDISAEIFKNKLLNISSDYTLEETGLRKVVYNEGSYVRTMLFKKASKDSVHYIFIDADAKSGEILSYSNFNNTSTTKKLDKDTLLKTANDICSTLSPEKFEEFKLTQDKDGYYTYTRYANDIPVPSDTISVEISPADGKLVSYRINYSNVKFPSPENVISPNMACKVYFENVTYTPLHIMQITKPELTQPDTTALVYAAEDTGVIIDAFRGERINGDGTTYQKTEKWTKYTDVAGHYAEKEIMALYRFGIGFKSEKFDPDKEISQKEFIEFANQGFGNVLSIHNLHSPAANILTRIEAARLICCALGIEKFGEIDKIYACPFKDIKEGKGYATLLWGLDIVNGTTMDTFSPNDGLTRGQAAILIYNAMQNVL